LLYEYREPQRLDIADKRLKIKMFKSGIVKKEFDRFFSRKYRLAMLALASFASLC
jgi:hypothetical protein